MKIPPKKILICLVLLSGCASNLRNEAVMGRAGGSGNGAAAAIELITRSGPGRGVRISARPGRGGGPVTLSGTETARLINGLELELKAWSAARTSPPFERAVAMGITSDSDWNPYSVELVRRSEERDPIFVISLGYAEGRSSLELDKENAGRWVGKLKLAAGY